MQPTLHQFISGSSASLQTVPDQSVALIVTSPPYPMIEMWNECFAQQDPKITKALKQERWDDAFQKMHEVLEKVWDECDRVLMPSGFVCVNIGDATRTCGGSFRLFSNHTRIIESFVRRGYSLLPDIIWRKQSNSPNKFMGSGMYPAGAYVTYEHEYILIFRKGGKREFHRQADRLLRRESAYFWEERNTWFSDLWEIVGVWQQMKRPATSRLRSAAFPLDIPFRLVAMYSVKGDTVLDPFGGTGTTALACASLERSSISADIDASLCTAAKERLCAARTELNALIQKRIADHEAFIRSLSEEKRNKCYHNEHLGMPVKTRQELEMRIRTVAAITQVPEGVRCTYRDLPGRDH